MGSHSRAPWWELSVRGGFARLGSITFIAVLYFWNAYSRGATSFNWIVLIAYVASALTIGVLMIRTSVRATRDQAEAEQP